MHHSKNPIFRNSGFSKFPDNSNQTNFPSPVNTVILLPIFQTFQ